MFMGEYRHSIDDKGRLIIPARFRAELGEAFILTRGLDHCLFVYPMEEWRQIEAKLRTLPLTKADARSFVRFFFSGAVECELDKQGRIMIPQNLREYAEIEKDVVAVGVSTRVELWSAGRWDKYVAEASESFDAIAESIVDLGI